MVTYGDMVTQILIFFVLLFALSTINMQKFQAAMQSFQMAVGILRGGAEIQPVDLSGEGDISEVPNADLVALQQLEQMYQRVGEYLQEAGLEGVAVTLMEQRGVVIRFKDQILFDLGKAELRPEARAILDKIGRLIAGIPNHVRVEGHTDNWPIHNERYPSNWELSTARATNVVRYLLETTHIPPKRLSAAGYGEYRPVASNATAEGRAKNRRVDIVILRQDLSEGEPR